MKPFATVQDSLSMFAQDPLEYQPGETYLYSTFAYSTLARIVEAASGTDFLTAMEERVLKPLGMKNTCADQWDKLILHRTRFYRRRNGTLEHAPEVDNSNKWAGGGFVSTAEDLVRFGNAILHPTKNNVIQQTKMARQLYTVQTLANGEPIDYGLGLELKVPKTVRKYNQKEPAKLTFGHSGGAVGASSYLLIVPQDDLVVSLLCNMEDTRLYDLAVQLADYYKKE